MDFDKFYGLISDAISMGDAIPIHAHTRFDELGDAWDSMARVMVISSIIDNYGVDVPGDALSSMDTMGDLASYVESNLSN